MLSVGVNMHYASAIKLLMDVLGSIDSLVNDQLGEIWAMFMKILKIIRAQYILSAESI